MTLFLNYLLLKIRLFYKLLLNNFLIKQAVIFFNIYTENKEGIIQEKIKIEEGDSYNIKEIKGKVNDFFKIYYSAERVYSEYLGENANVPHEPNLLNLVYIKLAFITLKFDFHKIAQVIYFDKSL